MRWMVVLVVAGLTIFDVVVLVSLHSYKEEIDTLKVMIDKVVCKEVPEGKGMVQEDNLTIKMWRTFEQELQEYKQRLVEGKRQFTEQKEEFSKVLTEARSFIQEYERLLDRESRFWERQLKGYDTLLAKNEERLQKLEDCVFRLEEIIGELSAEKEGEVTEMEEKTVEEGGYPEGQEQKEEVTKPKRVRITPRIEGNVEYKTYPEEGSVPTVQGTVIRGKITGKGNYKTY